MNKRIWLLLVLFSATLLIRGMHIYHLFSSPSSTIEWAAGASYTIEGNQLTVRSVRPKNPSGQPTLAAQGGLQKGDRILAIYNVRGAGKMIGVQYKTFPVGVREFALLWQTTLNTFVGYLFALFFLRFPSPSLLDRKAPWLNRLLLGLTIIVWLVSLATTWFEYTSFDQAQRLGNALTGFGKVFNLMVLLLFIVGLSSLLLNTVRAETKDEKWRMLILLAGAMVGLLPLVISSIFFPAEDRPPSLWRILMLGATLGIFPLSFVYVVVKHRVLGIRVILRRGLQY